jgi:hypothetical protein
VRQQLMVCRFHRWAAALTSFPAPASLAAPLLARGADGRLLGGARPAALGLALDASDSAAAARAAACVDAAEGRRGPADTGRKGAACWGAACWRPAPPAPVLAMLSVSPCCCSGTRVVADVAMLADPQELVSSSSAGTAAAAGAGGCTPAAATHHRAAAYSSMKKILNDKPVL